MMHALNHAMPVGQKAERIHFLFVRFSQKS